MGPRGHFESCPLAKERSAGSQLWLQNGGISGGPDWPHSRTSPAWPSPHPHLSGSAPEAGVSPQSSSLLPSQGSPSSSPSALLYMNADFEGGEFIFTEMDAKTVTVSWCCEPNAVPQQPVLRV